MKICIICGGNTSLSFKKNVLVLTVRTGLLQCKSHCCFTTSHWNLPAAGGSLTTAWFTLGNHGTLQHQVNASHLDAFQAIFMCFWRVCLLNSLSFSSSRLSAGVRTESHTNHLQVSMASEEETLTFGFSFVWEWSQVSSSSERSSSGKGTLQYWKEL